MPITIYSQPENQGVHKPKPATFNVGADSPTELKFKWYWNDGDGWRRVGGGTPPPPGTFSGADTESLTVNTGTGIDHGLFKCVLTNEGGDPFVWTQEASLTVSPEEQILVVPQTVTGTYKTGGGTKGSCPGPYSGAVSYTAPGTTKKWFTAPAGTTKITATDKSNFSTTRVEIIELQRMAVSCGLQTATFAKPVAGYQYAFTVYFGTGSGMDGPPDGTQISVVIAWT